MLGVGVTTALERGGSRGEATGGSGRRHTDVLRSSGGSSAADLSQKHHGIGTLLKRNAAVRVDAYDEGNGDENSENAEMMAMVAGMVRFDGDDDDEEAAGLLTQNKRKE